MDDIYGSLARMEALQGRGIAGENFARLLGQSVTPPQPPQAQWQALGPGTGTSGVSSAGNFSGTLAAGSAYGGSAGGSSPATSTNQGGWKYGGGTVAPTPAATPTTTGGGWLDDWRRQTSAVGGQRVNSLGQPLDENANVIGSQNSSSSSLAPSARYVPGKGYPIGSDFFGNTVYGSTPPKDPRFMMIG